MHKIMRATGVPAVKVDGMLKEAGVERPDERALARAAIEKL